MTQSPTGQDAATRPTPAVFVQRFSSTPLGARLARHLALYQLDTWGIAPGTQASDTAALIVAELGANAVTHGRVPGRDFELRLTLTTGAARTDDTSGRPPATAPAAGTLRIEVSDTRTECGPPKPGEVTAPAPLAAGGRGLLLVDALATRWYVHDRLPAPGKTVVAELDLPR